MVGWRAGRATEWKSERSIRSVPAFLRSSRTFEGRGCAAKTHPCSPSDLRCFDRRTGRNYGRIAPCFHRYGAIRMRISLFAARFVGFSDATPTARLTLRIWIKRRHNAFTFYSWNKIYGKTWIKILYCARLCPQLKRFTCLQQRGRRTAELYE